MMEDPRNITPCTHLLFVERNLERIGDLTTNIADVVVYQVYGFLLDYNLPKKDEGSTTIIEPDSRTEERDK